MDASHEKRPATLEEGRERRRYLRFPRAKLILFEESDSSVPNPGFVLDISVGGAKLLTQKPLKEGDLISVAIELEENKPFEVDCKVMWTRSIVSIPQYSNLGDGFFVQGVEFIYLSPPEQEEIRSYLDLAVEPELRTRVGQAEKRKYYRIETLITATCFDESGSALEIIIRDLSLGGCGFVSPVRLSLGTRYKIELKLEPPFPALLLDAKMVRVGTIGAGRYEGGMEFTSMTSEEKQVLAQFIRLRHKGGPADGPA